MTGKTRQERHGGKVAQIFAKTARDMRASTDNASGNK
jgi:hypothetical protein